MTTNAQLSSALRMIGQGFMDLAAAMETTLETKTQAPTETPAQAKASQTQMETQAQVTTEAMTLEELMDKIKPLVGMTGGRLKEHMKDIFAKHGSDTGFRGLPETSYSAVLKDTTELAHKLHEATGG